MLLQLIRKEVLLEFRQKSTLGGVLVYLAGTIFVTALCFKGRQLDKAAWNALFWVITLFTSVTVSAKSFQRESGGAAIFNYLLYPPRHFILAKILYNMLFMLVLSLLSFFFYSFFIGSQVDNLPLFLLVLVLASTGLAGTLSLMSAIAARSNGSFALMSILSFPVMMPLILVVIRISRQAVDGIEWAGVGFSFISILAALNALCIVLSLLLFPYLWRD
jgi:heme exporter protein B